MSRSIYLLTSKCFSSIFETTQNVFGYNFGPPLCFNIFFTTCFQGYNFCCTRRISKAQRYLNIQKYPAQKYPSSKNKKNSLYSLFLISYIPYFLYSLFLIFLIPYSLFLIKKFLINQEMKISYIFLKERFSYISGNGNPEKILIFQEMELLIFQKVTFRARKMIRTHS